MDEARGEATLRLRAAPDLAALDSAVRRCGYNLRLARLYLPVRGLSFGAAPQQIERRLLALEGVESAVVDPSRQTAIVDYVVGETTTDALRAAVSRAGFEADHPVGARRLREDRDTGAAVWPPIGALLLAIAGTILSLPLAGANPPGFPDSLVRFASDLTRPLLGPLLDLSPLAQEMVLGVLALVAAGAFARRRILEGMRALGKGLADRAALDALAIALALVGSIAAMAAGPLAGRRNDSAMVTWPTLLWLVFVASVLEYQEARVRSFASAALRDIPWRSRFHDGPARVIGLISLVVAALVFVIWLFLAPETPLLIASFAAIGVLAVGLPSWGSIGATMATARTMDALGKLGVTLRGIGALIRLGTADRVVLQSPGTVTEGRPRITDYLLLGGFEQRELLRHALALSQVATAPPLAGLAIPERWSSVVTDVSESPGDGISARVDGVRALLGKPAWVEQSGVSLEEVQGELERFTSEAKNVLVLAMDGAVRGAVIVGDAVIPEAEEAVKRLSALGVKVTLLTSDAEATARAVAARAGIDDVAADLAPAFQARELARIRRSGESIALVSRGPAERGLASNADLTVVLGEEGAADVRVPSALGEVAEAVELARSAARPSGTAAAVWHAAAIPLAAQLLYPLAGKLLWPVIPALAAVVALSVAVGRIPGKGQR